MKKLEIEILKIEPEQSSIYPRCPYCEQKLEEIYEAIENKWFSLSIRVVRK